MHTSTVDLNYHKSYTCLFIHEYGTVHVHNDSRSIYYLQFQI